MTAADIFVSCFMVLAAFPEGFAKGNPLWEWFGGRISLGEGRERCRAHIVRVQSYLEGPAQVQKRIGAR
ncbi:MAG: hypothetical protein ACI9F9_003017 [Candidatus Paceibacteria bacterium]|jgi:hypothetical protein